MSLLSMKQIWKYYHLGEAEIAAIRGVDLEVAQGEFVAIWGPSGCGKSTLCNLIGMIDLPSSGRIEFMGRETNTLTDDEKSDLRSNTVGFVFQNFNLMPVLSALENVMLPLQIQGKPHKIAKAKAAAALVEVGLADHLGHRPHKLSGGQQQRVAIARALITDPQLVIADEPTANLDSVNAERIIDLMREVSTERGTTFIFSTHDQRLLHRVQRLIHLNDGVIVEDCTTDTSQTLTDRNP